jgi:hypothetical protein
MTIANRTGPMASTARAGRAGTVCCLGGIDDRIALRTDVQVRRRRPSPPAADLTILFAQQPTSALK